MASITCLYIQPTSPVHARYQSRVSRVSGGGGGGGGRGTIEEQWGAGADTERGLRLYSQSILTIYGIVEFIYDEY